MLFFILIVYTYPLVLLRDKIGTFLFRQIAKRYPKDHKFALHKVDFHIRDRNELTSASDILKIKEVYDDILVMTGIYILTGIAAYL